MELNMLMGAGLGAVTGLVLVGVYAGWPSGKFRPVIRLIRDSWTDPLVPCILVLAIAVGALAAGLSGSPVQVIAAALFGWQLLLLGALDLSHRWLPDPLNLVLGLTGLGIAVVFAEETWPDQLLGLVAGYIGLELVRRGYRWLRGRDGLGGGDPKLFGAIGCWVGWQWLPWVLTLAALGGLLAAAALALAGRRGASDSQFPLGTLLAIAAWPIWLVIGTG